MTVAVTLDSLVDRALLGLRGPDEAGQTVVLPSAVDASQSTWPVIDGVFRHDVLEFGSELVRVTALSDVTPEMTVQRGYNFSAAVAHPSNRVGVRQPSLPRVRIENAVLESFASLEANRVLPTVNAELAVSQPLSGRPVVEVPAEVREVLQVRGSDFTDVPNWRFLSDLPSSVVGSGQAVRLPRVPRFDSVLVTWTAPYRWSSWPNRPDGSATVEMIEGTEHLPAKYATAVMLSGREISRQEVDRAAEWNQAEPSRGGISTSFVRQVWQDYYRSLDEARRLNPLPTRIHVHRRQLLGMGR